MRDNRDLRGRARRRVRLARGLHGHGIGQGNRSRGKIVHLGGGTRSHRLAWAQARHANLPEGCVSSCDTIHAPVQRAVVRAAHLRGKRQAMTRGACRRHGGEGHRNTGRARQDRQRSLRDSRGVRLGSDRDGHTVGIGRCVGRSVRRRGSECAADGLNRRARQGAARRARAARSGERPAQRRARIRAGHRLQCGRNARRASGSDTPGRCDVQCKIAGDGDVSARLFRRIGNALRVDRDAPERRHDLWCGVIAAGVDCAAIRRARRAGELPAHCGVGVSVAHKRTPKRLNRAELDACRPRRHAEGDIARHRDLRAGGFRQVGLACRADFHVRR